MGVYSIFLRNSYSLIIDDIYIYKVATLCSSIPLKYTTIFALISYIVIVGLQADEFIV